MGQRLGEPLPRYRCYSRELLKNRRQLSVEKSGDLQNLPAFIPREAMCQYKRMRRWNSGQTRELLA